MTGPRQPAVGRARPVYGVTQTIPGTSGPPGTAGPPSSVAPPPRPDHRRLMYRGAAVVLAIAGIAMLGFGAGLRVPLGPLIAAPPATAASSVPTRAVPSRPAPLARSTPVRLDIPRVGIHTNVMGLGLGPGGAITVPPLTQGAPAGWYRHLASPGERGPAVILGHVDTDRYGPAVFFRLRLLRPGDVVSVRRADASTAVFTVVRVAEYAKKAFPVQAVYGPVNYPALRLVTCGGAFDYVHRQYQDNVVAYAVLSHTRGRH